MTIFFKSKLTRIRALYSCTKSIMLPSLHLWESSSQIFCFWRLCYPIVKCFYSKKRVSKLYSAIQNQPTICFGTDHEWIKVFHFRVVEKEQKNNNAWLLKLYQIQISVSIKFYWNTVILTLLSHHNHMLNSWDRYKWYLKSKYL